MADLELLAQRFGRLVAHAQLVDAQPQLLSLQHNTNGQCTAYWLLAVHVQLVDAQPQLLSLRKE